MLHAITTRRLARKLTRSEWRLDLIGFAFAAVFLGMYLLWDPVQCDFRISPPITCESTQLLQAAGLIETDPLRLLLDAGGNPDDGIHAAVSNLRLQQIR
ncbi:MAG: hypothetical protein WBP44_09425 [Gammaproteobacteria bacterium]|jgi:hypothetical protein